MCRSGEVGDAGDVDDWGCDEDKDEEDKGEDDKGEVVDRGADAPERDWWNQYSCSRSASMISDINESNRLAWPTK